MTDVRAPAIMRWLGGLVLAGACGTSGCVDDAPGARLEIVPHEGDAIRRTRVDCEGEVLLTSCDPRVVRQTSPSSLGDVHLVFDPSFGTMLVIWLEGDATVEEARAVVASGCDEECVPPTEIVVGGWIAVDAYSVTGRNAGRFHVELDGGAVVRGSYDLDDRER
jgi:hypothetical protein